MALVEFEVHGKIALIRFNRPEQRNAVTSAMAEEIKAALKRLEGDASLCVAVLTGAGKVFCAGMDLGAFANGDRSGVTDPDRFAGFVAAARSKPVIAAVNGGALAGGFEIMLACDMAIADEGAVFGLPEVKRGLIAGGGGVIRLPRRIPFAVANEMLLTGDTISADKALELGLVNSVVPRGELIPAAMALADRIAANAPLSVSASVSLSRAATFAGETELWSLTDRLWSKIDGSADSLEGATAFKEKRPPVWTGR